jgi:DNA-binding transcriptional ArsR family regulator
VLDVIIEIVDRSASALVPLFRSEQQLRLLAVLFAEDVDEVTVGELAERARVAQATASREVARLAEHGIVVTRALGRNTLVSANWDLPWSSELRSILVQTVGVLGRLADVLHPVPGIIEAFVFGSWAARHAGQPGPPPRDIDLLVVGDASLPSLRRACRPEEAQLRVDVNPVVVDLERWQANDADPFVAQVRGQPLVPIPLDSRT